MINARKVLYLMAMGILTFTACKKKEDQSVKTRLTGKWKVTAIAKDLNGNGVVDAGEKSDWPDSLIETYSFNGDGTGVFVWPAASMIGNFTWTLINNDADMKIKNDSGQESITHIESISNSDLVFKDTNTAGSTTTVSWGYFKKQ